MENQKYIAYYRVSTQKQGNSGLGLESQRQQVQNFVNCNECIIAEFTEIESGKKDNREQLTKAIATAKKEGAKLVIAKLDRLSRNANFIFTLRDSGVDFVCTDMPEANTLTIGIFAVMAQHEREIISSRTKAGLKVKSERLALEGKKLGTPKNLTIEARQRGFEVRQHNAKTKKENVQATALATMHRQKGATLQTIADTLNGLGFNTSKGKVFMPTTVKFLLDRAGVKKPTKSSPVLTSAHQLTSANSSPVLTSAQQ